MGFADTVSVDARTDHATRRAPPSSPAESTCSCWSPIQNFLQHPKLPVLSPLSVVDARLILTTAYDGSMTSRNGGRRKISMTYDDDDDRFIIDNNIIIMIDDETTINNNNNIIIHII